MSEIQIKAYKCDKCGKIYVDKSVAEICCKQYFCEYCGKETPKYFLACSECSDKRNFEKATKMTYEEYIEKYPNYPIFDRNEEDCEWDMETLIEKYEEGDPVG